MISTHRDAIDAMQRHELGKVSFLWGDNKSGICHIISKRVDEGSDGAEIAKLMPEVIAKGRIVKWQGSGDGKRVLIEYSGHTAVLSLKHMGVRQTWLVTGWDNRP